MGKSVEEVVKEVEEYREKTKRDFGYLENLIIEFYKYCL